MLKTENQDQRFDKVFNHDEESVTIKEESVTIKKDKRLKSDESSLVYESKYSFSEYRSVGKYFSLSLMTKYDSLLPFYHRLNELRNFIPQIEKTKIKKEIVYNMLKNYIRHN